MINTVISLVIFFVILWFAVASSLYIARKKQLQREGKIDRYGNTIEKPEEPEKPNWNINEGV